MTRVRFTRDYRGRATDEKFYRAGAVGEFDDQAAAALLAEGAAVAVSPLAPVSAPDDAADSPAHYQKQARERAHQAARNAMARRWAR